MSSESDKYILKLIGPTTLITLYNCETYFENHKFYIIAKIILTEKCKMRNLNFSFKFFLGR